MKLSKFIARFILITAFSSVILAFLVSIIFQYINFKSDLAHLRDELTEQKKREVKNEVNMLHGLIKYKEELLKKTVQNRLKDRVNQAYTLAMNIYELNKKIKTEDEIKYLIANALKNFRFENDDSYFFINSNKGQSILYSEQVTLDKYIDIWDLKDLNGKPIIQIQSKIATEQKEGFSINSFTKPNSQNQTQFLKLSFIKLFEPYDWHIGMGEYLDDLRNKNQEELLSWIGTLENENSNYTFINSIDGLSLVFEGNKLEKPKKHPSPELFIKQLEISKNSEGDFFEYKFKKPNSSEEFEKISFVKQFEEYGWIIGCGVYLDEIEAEIKRKEAIFEENIKNQIASMVVIFILILMIIYFLSIKISDFINNNIKNLIQAFRKASTENKKINTDELTYKEFVLLANNLNKALEDKNIIEKELQDYIRIVNQNVIISSTNKDGLITDISEAFCEISGYKKYELLGKTHKLVRHPDTSIDFYKNMWDTLLQGKEWKGEIKNLTKNGDTYWVYAIITPIIKDDIIKGFTAIRSNITDKKHIEHLSITDELTKLYNRRFFNLKIEEEINRAKREDKSLCLMILDIDYFKQYNDTYGHQKGDFVLQKVAEVLKNSTNRASDFAFRVGGEEFAIVTILKKDKVLNYAKAIKESIYNLKIEHSNSLVSNYITCSIGISCKMAKDIKNSDEIYKEADDNLYEAKNIGRNSIHVNEK
ncbi:cache domain-containing protein [Aliarcobacter cibarius]|uniref:diguanylate cyclase n=1 Tax=Aliarcobacter cibarius TaxID=255507 RepID=A0A7L5JRI8_9BACT|nr:cache domain-containing protein [Aliarcobacter cibarius]QKJ27716.1 multi-sensor domain-containing diguanylate cyclase [Aliarcobacter cibarius]TLS96479.1 diguanylate cyclase [Aliarcobacter cibarius]TLS97730.1 diguanylate cyclase [Aliarcobacter cibarius]TLT05020.1 diguanylate cyclase [Aliarcobacter cibarius]